MTEIEIRERLVKLEGKVERLDEMANKIDELYELMHQAKGARWAVLAVVGMAGFIGGKLGTVVPFLNGLPK